MLKSVRGATTSANTEADILRCTEELLRAVMDANGINNDDIVSATFTATKDLDAAYPARAARSLGLTSASLMCVQEMDVVGSLRQCIRVMILFETEKRQDEIRHIYINGAKGLRPDLLRRD